MVITYTKNVYSILVLLMLLGLVPCSGCHMSLLDYQPHRIMEFLIFMFINNLSKKTDYFVLPYESKLLETKW
jgi:hypothetical protein